MSDSLEVTGLEVREEWHPLTQNVCGEPQGSGDPAGSPSPALPVTELLALCSQVHPSKFFVLLGQNCIFHFCLANCLYARLWVGDAKTRLQSWSGRGGERWVGFLLDDPKGHAWDTSPSGSRQFLQLQTSSLQFSTICRINLLMPLTGSSSGGTNRQTNKNCLIYQGMLAFLKGFILGWLTFLVAADIYLI